MSIFQHVQIVSADPILGLLETFRADSRADKVNLTVGVYQDETGRTPILPTVHCAEKRILETETTKDYIAIAGDPALTALVPGLIWPGADRPASLCTLQTLGGSGALRVVADFLRCEAPAATVWISEPSWPNHPGIFGACGLAVSRYRYYDSVRSQVDVAGMAGDLRRAQPGDAVVLHACCHNPTGTDLDDVGWEAIGQVIREHQLLPVIDLAYQGFAKGIPEDAVVIQRLARTVADMFVCISFSKTFGLYRERAGALIAVGSDPTSMAAVASRLRACARTNYSNPPSHGGAIVSTILGDAALRARWQGEVDQMRTRIQQTRAELVRALQAAQAAGDFSFLARQHGLFAMTGLTRHQVTRLRDEFAIYLVDNGRMNVAGLNETNLGRVAECIAAALR